MISACTTLSESEKAKIAEVDWQNLLIEKAKAGYPQAEYAMAKLSCCSNRRMAETVAWLCSAAESNIPQAFFDLGRVYSNTYPADYAATPNYSMALAFYNLAEKNGFDGPKVLHNYRHATMQHMDSREVAYSNELMAKWPNIPCGTRGIGEEK
jgi:TPR repeat protein